MSAVASQANEAIQSEAIVSFHGSGGEINGLTIGKRHAVGLLSTRAQDSAACRENAGDILQMKDTRVIFNEAPKTLFNADDLDVVKAHGGLGDAADGRVQAGTISSTRENADAARSTRGRQAEFSGLLILVPAGASWNSEFDLLLQL
jgi:hypothetical protein